MSREGQGEAGAAAVLTTSEIKAGDKLRIPYEGLFLNVQVLTIEPLFKYDSLVPRRAQVYCAALGQQTRYHFEQGATYEIID